MPQEDIFGMSIKYVKGVEKQEDLSKLGIYSVT